MMRTVLQSIVLMTISGNLYAQIASDTLRTQQLREVNIKTTREYISYLPQTQNGYIWSGKKNEVINLQNLDAPLGEKTPRQIFAKVPGVFVYDMDGSGNQTNISTRGLDPHRGWEFNIRANGIMTNSDIYGYPASHFSLPFEAVGRIELVRGTGALQYGAQFGGMLNYVLKQPDTTRAFSLETTQSAGSYGLLSNYTAIGGRLGKFNYYAFYSKRVSTGYRKNSESDYDGQGLCLTFNASRKLLLKTTLLRSNYLYHIPGPLTDAMFQADPRQATRSRNYFNPEIWVPSFELTWKPSTKTEVRVALSAILGERRSVMFDRPATVRDSINASTGKYNSRQVDIDGFSSHTAELKLLQKYRLFGQMHQVSAGVQYFNNNLHRRQLGVGTTGSDYDLTITQAGWGRDLHLASENIAISMENRFQLSKRLSVSPGFRLELGQSVLSGQTAYYDPEELTNTIRHHFPLFGVSGEFLLNNNQRIYGGWSQAYRPVIFKDIIPANIYEQSDKNLKDAIGYNLELGWRGKSGDFKWDLTAFSLAYNNRLGSIVRYDAQTDTFILFRTNIGDSRTNGLEIFGEYGHSLSENWHVSVFSSTAFFDARYLGDSLRVNGKENRSIRGNRVESVPECITRNGLTLKYKQWSISMLYSYTGATFSDAINTVEPSANGAVGKVPAYGLLDCNASLRVRNFIFRAGISNLSDLHYFTKRPTFYPGPGIWPSDGRGFSCSLTITL